MKLFSLFGFDVFVDASWLLIALLIGWTLGGAVFPATLPGQTQATYWSMGAAATVGLMLSIVLHETAHSLVARHYGLAIRRITLFIFGGVAEMQGEPDRPRTEFLMAIAGPLASALLAFAFTGGFLALAEVPGAAPLAIVLRYLGMINGMLAAFNLLPAFPLDGGRMLRAALWGWRGDVAWATRLAAGAGSWFGMALIVLGVIEVLHGDVIGGIWSVLIGMFLRGAAAAELNALLMQRSLAGVSVAAAMNREPVTVAADVPVATFVEDYVYRHHHRWFPVAEQGRVVGSVSTREAAAVPRSEWPMTPVSAIMLPFAEEDAIDPDTALNDAWRQMRRSGRSRLMVVRAGRLLGILSSSDVLELIALHQQFDNPWRQAAR
jgi:Zn-dependent protease/predicted transcriptional regulator